MKSNDKIPHDEMLLAEAIAAAKARNMAWTSGYIFLDENKNDLYRSGEGAAFCCAIGGLLLAGVDPTESGLYEDDVGNGNDESSKWMEDEPNATDCGESLGWAFRCAMEDSP